MSFMFLGMSITDSKIACAEKKLCVLVQCLVFKISSGTVCHFHSVSQLVGLCHGYGSISWQTRSCSGAITPTAGDGDNSTEANIISQRCHWQPYEAHIITSRDVAFVRLFLAPCASCASCVSCASCASCASCQHPAFAPRVFSSTWNYRGTVRRDL